MAPSADASIPGRTGDRHSEAPLADRLYRSRWLGAVNVALAVGIGVGTILLGSASTLTPARVLLVGSALLPWTLELFEVPVPRLVFAAMVLAPVAALTHEGRDSFAFMFLVLLNGETASVARPGVVGSVLAASVGVVAWSSAAAHELSWPFWVAGIALGVFAGRLMNVQRRLVSELEEAQHELRRQAAADERRRIAREVHDVIAHSLTVTLLHLSAARMAMDTDPSEAAEALEEAERAGRQSLADIRRAVGLLRNEGEDGDALPGADDVPALVEGYRHAGISARLRVEGDLSRIPLSAGLTVYRIVQESLANAAKHAPGARADVSIRTGEDGISVRVSDSGAAERGGAAPGTAPGVGLIGMRERASLLGGTLTAGPAAGGWAVECSLPATIDEPAETPQPTRTNR